MTRQIHDQFAKEYLEELLAPLGTIKKSNKVKSEVQEIDVSNKTLTVAELPVLWILTPTFSARMVQGFRADSDDSNWLKGVYFLADFLKVGIVAIHQLPVNQDTLWLRVLGKGGTQKRAVEELVGLPESTPGRENLLEILANWRKNLELRDNLSRDEQEDIMNLSPAYLKQREEWKIEGIQEGTKQGQLSVIASLLEGRFGTLDSELSGLVEQIAQLPISERTQLLLSLANLSREQLLERLRGN